MAEKLKYLYGKQNLSFVVPVNGGKPSPLDNKLASQWAKCLKEGLFRYEVIAPNSLPTRVTSGPLRLVLTLNQCRSTLRRCPESLTNLRQPFGENAFNFLKIRPEETIAKIQYFDDDAGKDPPQNKDEDKDNLLIINVSPFEYGHYLFVPDIFAKWTQLLHRPSHLCQALHIVLLSSSPNIRLCFNSICACASINHFHFHIYYHHQRLALETTLFKRVVPDSDVYLLDDVGQNVTCKGFAFQIHTEQEINVVCEKVCKLADYFLEKDVAYNLYATRGMSFERHELDKNDSTPGESFTVLRVFLWPRKKFLRSKSLASLSLDDPLFIVASCELAGHIILPDCSVFDGLTEEAAMEVYRKSALDEATWKDLMLFACCL